MLQRAKLFMNGQSQAVRLPKAYRFSGKEVLIRKKGAQIILEPINHGWSEEFWHCLGQASEDFVRPAITHQSREVLFK